jgi:hypothetical protein
MSSVYDKSKNMMIAQTSNRRRRFLWLILVSHRRRRFLWFKLSFDRFTFVLLFRFWFAFALSRPYHRMICAGFKTTKSFCQMISKRSSLFVKWSQNDQVFSDRTFWILSHVWGFYSALNSCTRKRHSAVIEDIIRDVMMIDDDDQRMMWRFVSFSERKCFHTLRSHSSIFLFSSNSDLSAVIIISCLSRWSYCAICLWGLSVVKRFMHSWECSVSYYQSSFISVFLERSTSWSSHAWASLRCRNCSSSLVARRYFDTLAINSKMSRSVNKFVSRLFVHIFFRRSSNFEHFSNVWCIVCLRASHEHRENSVASILWR